MVAVAIPQVSARAEIESMVRRIVAEFDPNQVILFGSWAHGTARFDSDVDLIVVMSVDAPRFGNSRYAAAVEIYRALADRVLPLDVVVLTPDQLVTEAVVVGTLAHSVMGNGVVVYERAA